MPHNLIPLIGLVVPIIVMVALRINASLVFLSLCLGSVLVQYVASQANDLLKLLAPHAGTVSTSTIQLALLLLPAVLTAVVTVFSVHGRLKSLLNAVPAAAASLFAALLVGPLLTPAVRKSLGGQPIWHVLSKAEALVVGGGAVASLVFLWTQRGSFRKADKRRH